MKIWIESIFGKSEILRAAKKVGVKIDRQKPDFVITYGGDGTILKAEQRYPGIPKIPIRKSRVSSMCVSYRLSEIEKILKRLKSGRYKLKKINKVEAIFKNKRIVGLNEVQVHNKDPRKAVRFDLFLESKIKGRAGNRRFPEIVGDGVVFATSYGSTAYYRSLGLKPFKSGIRIGFNNVYPPKKPIGLTGNADVKILRERALLVADNCSILELKPGDRVKIRKSNQRAVFVKI